MKSSYNVALVIPCYNEEYRLQIDSFTNKLFKHPNLTFLFVNDGSKDNTLKVIEKICLINPERALSLSLDKNQGKGEAVRKGMCYLVDMKKYNLIGFWDADLAVSLSELYDFVEVFQSNSDVRAVIGSRVHLAGRKIQRVNIRHYIGRLFTTIIDLTFGFNIYDTQCGAKLFDSKILIPVIQEVFCSNWIFDVELIIRISNLSFLKDNWLWEVPVKEWKNVSATKRSFSAYLSGFNDYIKLVKKYLL